MHLWPSKKVRDFFTVSHLDFIERNRREKLLQRRLLQKQTSRSRSFNREVAEEGETPSATPRGGGGNEAGGGGVDFWKEFLYTCCCLDFWFGCSDEE